MITEKIILDRCKKNNKTLTPTRILIYNILNNSSKPKSAYEIQRNLKNDKKDINISTIYRVMEFWIKLGIVHKLSTINKFLLCVKPEEKHIHMLHLCTKCEKVFETCDKDMGMDFKRKGLLKDMVINSNSSIEVPVLCSKCK